jgi:hypothetical protein
LSEVLQAFALDFQVFQFGKRANRLSKSHGRLARRRAAIVKICVSPASLPLRAGSMASISSDANVMDLTFELIIRAFLLENVLRSTRSWILRERS